MSMSYWMIYGLGFSMDDLAPYLDADKIRQKLLEQKSISITSEDAARWEKINDWARLELLQDCTDTSFGFADLMAESDQKHLLSYGNDGENGSYLYYEPSYPWDRKEQECQTEEAAREHICDVTMPFVGDDVMREDILNLIYEVNQVGCG